MRDFNNVRKGTQIYTEDGQYIGTVEDVTNNEITFGGQRYQANAFSRFDNNRLYLAQQYAQQGQQQYSVPLAEEQLRVGKQQVQAGEVNVQKRVVSEQVNVPVELRREEVNVQQRDLPDRPLQAGEVEQAFQEGTIRVPLRAEEAVVQKQAYVTGEVVLNKDVQTEQRNVTDTVRREQVYVDRENTTTRGTETDTQYYTDTDQDNRNYRQQ